MGRPLSAAAPEVSVVIATRNRARWLPGALESALGQERVGLEVIVVDDGSTDETPALLTAIEDPRVRAVRLDPARGRAAARNEGIEAARGTWIAFLDDDDLWSPVKLRRQLDEAVRTGATWVYCGVLLLSPEGELARVRVPGDPAGILRELLRSNVVHAGASTVIVDAERLRAVGAFQNGFNNPWDLWIRLAADGPAAVVEDALAAYRRHPASFISTSRDEALREADTIAARHRDLAREHGVEFDRDHYARWLESEAVRALRSSALAALGRGARRDALRLQLRVLARTRSWPDLRRLLRIAAGERSRDALRRLRPVAAEGALDPTPAWLVPYVGS